MDLIYNKKYTWKRLCEKAGQIDNYPSINETEIYRAISKKWLSCSSTSYFEFILLLAKRNFQVDLTKMNETEKTMCLMLYYDVWQNPGQFTSLEESIRAIGDNPVLVEEIIELLEILVDKIDFLEKEIELPYEQPLKVHSRYTRDQILVAFGLSAFEFKSSNREGIANNANINTEILFVDLIKSESDFSPTTLYEDYAISDTLFHWQSQNASRPDTGRGLSYIQHEELGKIILLFVREQNKNEYKNTMSYVFIGKGRLTDYYGSKPMSITWELSESMPPYLWKETAKMAVG